MSKIDVQTIPEGEREAQGCMGLQHSTLHMLCGFTIYTHSIDLYILYTHVYIALDVVLDKSVLIVFITIITLIIMVAT